MFLYVQWKTPRQIERTSVREATTYGEVDVWLQSWNGRAELALLFHGETMGGYAVPAALLCMSEKLQNLVGDSPKLEFTPVPSTWVNSHCQETAERAGFTARLRGRTLELSAQVGVGEALARAALVACALDSKCRTNPQILQNALRIALRQQVDLEGLFRLATSNTSKGHTNSELAGLPVDSRWVCYLPPAIATLQDEGIDGELEDPSLVFDYYRNERVGKLIAELSRGGAQAVAVICRDAETALKRFGVSGVGSVYSPKGRAILSSSNLVGDLQKGLARAGFWKRFETDWVCLEGELLPFAPHVTQLQKHSDILAAGEARCAAAVAALKQFDAVDRIAGSRDCLLKYRALCDDLAKGSADPISFAPIHLIAVENRSFFGMTHLWHMQTLNALSRRAGAPFEETPYRFFSLDDQKEAEACLSWWQETPGLFIKTLPFLPKGKRGAAQPGYWCRSRDRLRLVYGPEYDLPENRLWLGARKSLAGRKNKRRKILKQWSLAIEGVERFLSRAPLEQIEECTRGVLALD